MTTPGAATNMRATTDADAGPDAGKRLARVSELYQRGKYLDALRASEPLGPPAQWPGTRGRVLAGRLANNLGAPRLGRVLHLLAHRNAPEDWDARYFYIWARFMRRGPLVAWKKMEDFGEPTEDARDIARADWLALKAHALAMLRDFEAAEALLERAVDLAPDRAWVWVERACVLEMEDRYEEAVEAAQQALDLRPYYRPAVQSAAHALVQLNRDDDALELLHNASAELQSGDVIAQLAALQTELRMYEAARANLERLPEYYPLLRYDRHRRVWLAAQRADAAYHCGDIETAVRLAEESESPFHKQLVERLSQAGADGRRHELPVPFVKQHHNTCGPATLSSIMQYWQHPVDHLEVVEKICYDGTPAHSERQWVEENGFVAREFALTWETGKAVLDLGVPFTLTTVDPGNAHLQAVHGYDERRGSMLVRDPGERHTAEFFAEKFIEHYAPWGPRAMAAVPRDWLDENAVDPPVPDTPLPDTPVPDTRIGADGAPVHRAEFAAQFNAIELPDAELYDLYYRIESALQRHDRQAASAAHSEMRAIDPDHRLTIHGRRVIAVYDADEPKMLNCVERLLKLYPDDVNLRMMQLQLLGSLGRRDRRREILEEICARHDCDPYFWQQMALDLSSDARQYQRVYQLVQRSMRYRPLDDRGIALWADVLWDQPERRGDAVTLYRFAACLGERDEGRARSYLLASRHLHRTDEALRFLEDRFARFGRQKSWAAQTLVWAYEVLDRTGDALATLEKALELRPDDGELLVFAADFYSRYGRNQRARELLRAARDKTHATQWMRTAAGIEHTQGNLQAALDCWRKVLAAEPLAQDANRMVAELTGDLEGREAAIQHLQAALARFPHSYAIHSLLLEWQSAVGAPEAEQAAREMLERFPVDAYARRELAIALVRQSKWEEAAQETELAEQLEPNHPLCAFLRGRIEHAAGRNDEARAAFREAIRTSIDYDPAVGALVAMCDTQAERETELAFIYAELVRQVTFGEGLLAYRDYAATTWPPEKLLGQLREALDARPDLWQAYSALVLQLIDMERLDEALGIAERATQRFPLLPRVWADLAQVHWARRDTAGQIATLEKALEINPFYGDAARQLADALLRAGRLGEARSAIEKAVAGAPREIPNYGTLGDVLWAQGEHDAAIAEVSRAVVQEPGYEYGWHQLRRWTAQLGKPETVLQLHRDLTRRRPYEPRSWRLLAEALIETEHRDECLAAFDKAIELNPRDVESHSAKAYVLAHAGEFDQALAACRPAVFGDQPPIELRGRAAEVLALRGDYDEAIAAIRRVLEDDPNYLWAWGKLTGWHLELQRLEDYFRAADEFTRVAPRSPVAWGYRADAHRQLDRRSEALRDYIKAFELDPSYTYAALSLIDMYLENQDPGEAEAVLAAAIDMPPDYKMSSRVRIAAARRQLKDTIALLRHLCTLPDADGDALRAAAADMWDANYAGELADVLSECWSDPHASPEVAILWVQVSAMLGRLPVVARSLKARGPEAPNWEAAAHQYLLQVGEIKDLAALRRFLKRHRAAVEASDALWAAAGDALYQCGDRPRAIAWLSAWEQRDPQPHMLFPLVLAYWETGRVDDALQVGSRALKLPPDDSSVLHALFQAMGRAVRGQALQAQQALEAAPRAALNEAYHHLYDAAAMLAKLLSASPAEIPYRQARRQLAGATAGIRATAKQQRLDAHLLHLCRAALAQHYGKAVAAAWHRLRAKFAV